MLTHIISAYLAKRRLLLFFILIVVSVSAFNLYATSFNVVILNDNTLLQPYAHPLTLHKILYDRGLPLTTIINNSIFKYIFPVSPNLTRVFIVAFCMIPLSFLLFLLYRSYFRVPAIAAFVAAVLPNISPNQTLIPIFINGSYITYALLPFIAFAIYGILSVTKDHQYSKNIFICTIFLILSLLSTELAFFLLIPAVISFVLLAKYSKRLIHLALIITTFVTLKLVWYWSFSRHGANTISPQPMNEVANRILKFLHGTIPLNSSHLSNSVLVFVFSMIMLTAFIITVYFIRNNFNLKTIAKDKTSLDYSHAFFMGVAVVFGFTWVLATSIPYVFLSSHAFSDRYAYASGIGFSLILVAIPLYIFGNKEPFIKILEFLLLLLVMTSGIQRINMLTKTYIPIDNVTRELKNALLEKEFPKYSQIVIVGEQLKQLRTGGKLIWSTGFLQFNLKRKYIRGLIGPKYSFYNPFKPWKDDRSHRMTGLSNDFPLFLYEYTSSPKVLRQYEYALIYKKETAAWIIYKLHKTEGIAWPIDQGFNKSTLEDAIMKLKLRGIDSSDIFWLFDAKVQNNNTPN